MHVLLDPGQSKSLQQLHYTAQAAHSSQEGRTQGGHKAEADWERAMCSKVLRQAKSRRSHADGQWCSCAAAPSTQLEKAQKQSDKACYFIESM